MTFKNLCLFLLMGMLAACVQQKNYTGSRYSFHNPNFMLDTTLHLRTDGVYIAAKTWTKNSTATPPKEKLVYKFYKGGQVNMLIDQNNELTSAADFVNAFNRENKSTALFKGYFRIEGERLVLQRMVSPRGVLEYNYGWVKNDSLVFVSSTIAGRGKIDDKYFTDYYKAYFVFVPTAGDYTNPNW